MPNWANIPAGFNWVAVDSDGEVFAYKEKPTTSVSVWLNEYADFKSLGYIEEPQGDYWKTMIYERPKSAAA